MKTFITKLVFRIHATRKQNHRQFEESVRIIIARDSGEACFKALQLGKELETTISDIRGGEVTWEFVGLADLQESDSIVDQQELYSSIHEEESADDYHLYITQLSEQTIRLNRHKMIALA